MADPVPINEVNPIMSTYSLSSEVKFEAVYDMLHVRDEPEFQNDVTNKEYVDQKIKSSIDTLIGDAGAAYDTLVELRDALNDTSNPDSAASLISVITGQVVAEETRAKQVEATLAGLISDEETRATGVEATLTGLITAEETRATGVEATLAGLITAEETRAKQEEATLTGLITAEETRAKQEEATLSNNKLNRNLASGIDYGYEEDNITIKSVEVAPVINVKSGIISLGDRWRINCNAGADDVPRLVFEYKKVVDDDSTWVVGIPFIQSLPRS